MPDTQWPRFMVFQQSGEAEPLLHNGTVHAPDVEMALLNARDVFARRPEAVSMWVVPADAIYTQTREELAAGLPADPATGQPADYYVFAKFSEQTQCSYVGEVRAGSPQAAMRAAIEKFRGQDPLWWWVFPASVVVRSDAGEAGPMFAPARAKTFKDQAEYPVVTMMRQLRSKGKLDKK
ncbi:MAG: hypothetical protein WEA61_05950 [Anaerolineales bacterium]